MSEAERTRREVGWVRGKEPRLRCDQVEVGEDQPQMRKEPSDWTARRRRGGGVGERAGDVEDG